MSIKFVIIFVIIVIQEIKVSEQSAAAALVYIVQRYSLMQSGRNSLKLMSFLRSEATDVSYDSDHQLVPTMSKPPSSTRDVDKKNNCE